ncbi:hypothetical protein [Guptibacillus algicola]|uniref:hypothetical protein n=1 Tax=Guptibacillus algicola TaxID=225844 RepID=UPI001CD1CA3E|nr:hypothetical protein [Alkalihalobacillus algicola]MCA0987570.1 hypothetical protein [Alkalihalobacillus algicola]
MKKKAIVLTMVAALSTGSLAACNTDQDDMNQQPEDVNYDPVRYDNNRDNDMDMNRRDIRQPNERDTPNNMDEEEPDLDEEPSEQRRQDRRDRNY